MSTDTKKAKALDLAITQIDRQFGKGSIMRLGDNQFSQMENVISTGCLSLDVALGVGGVPKGRIRTCRRSRIFEETGRGYRRTADLPAR